MKVYNATRHYQGDNIDDWNELDIKFVPTTGPGVNSLPPRSDIPRIEREALDTMGKIQASGAEAVLIGGITGLAVLVAIMSVNSGLRIIEPSISHKNEHGRPVIVGYRDLTELVQKVMAD